MMLDIGRALEGTEGSWGCTGDWLDAVQPSQFEGFCFRPGHCRRVSMMRAAEKANFSPTVERPVAGLLFLCVSLGNHSHQNGELKNELAGLSKSSNDRDCGMGGALYQGS
jgi:hypothetical protein